MRAVVVGAGVAGLAAAVGLARLGWEVQVLERRGAVDEAGSGMSLWPNGLRALDALGVGAELRTGATIGGDSGVRRPDGRWIARTAMGAEVVRRFGDPLIIVRRRRLVDALARALPPGVVRTGTAVVTADPAGAVETADGERIRADLVVGADGARSGLRAALHPGHPGPQYAGFTTWRLLVDRPGGVPAETWGPDGARFAVLPLADGGTYCYAVAFVPEGGRNTDEVAALRARFGGWHAPIPSILDAVEPGAVIRTDVIDLLQPVPGLVTGSVALIGDAAHPMTPDIGQGGGIALEDAVELALAVAPVSDPAALPAALARFDALRRPRGADVAGRSRRAAALYRRPERLQGLAARALGLLPPATIVRQLTPVVDWRPSGRLPAGPVSRRA